MLGQPETRESPLFRVSGEVQGIPKRLRDGSAHPYWRKIEN
jgi:hypothetical protein